MLAMLLTFVMLVLSAVAALLALLTNITPYFGACLKQHECCMCCLLTDTRASTFLKCMSYGLCSFVVCAHCSSLCPSIAVLLPPLGLGPFIGVLVIIALDKQKAEPTATPSLIASPMMVGKSEAGGSLVGWPNSPSDSE